MSLRPHRDDLIRKYEKAVEQHKESAAALEAVAPFVARLNKAEAQLLDDPCADEQQIVNDAIAIESALSEAYDESEAETATLLAARTAATAFRVAAEEDLDACRTQNP